MRVLNYMVEYATIIRGGILNTSGRGRRSGWERNLTGTPESCTVAWRNHGCE